ncbi:hypothetical protein EIP91_010529 [Steccherinum ochraceum]|uniref:BTB domain-containing protein n=1 Tax=Steccherinum ochraceum TaxID=92696 RepID=A0A4R0R0H6_9APHY|nr:hypothetical protein EIP91_010529 [Steccherinum ochraceum]
MTNNSPSKRASNDAASDGEESLAEYKRSEAFWLRDGNVILVAEKIAFRVHQSVLERKSVVFQDMFGVPQPENVETLEECPLVHVSDAAEDIKHMLSVLYDGDRFLNLQSNISMKMVFALLQLGIKYQIDYLRDEAISVIKFVYPPSYDEYMENNAERVTEQSYADDAIAVINLAWKHGLHSLLPSAFFVCALMSNQELAEATGRQGLTKLSPNDLRRCLDGREILQTRYHDRYHPLDCVIVSEFCLNPEDCDWEVRDTWSHDAWDCTTSILEFDFDIMKELDWIKAAHLCEACRTHYEYADQEARKDMYNDLAVIFGLEKFMQGDVDA